MSAEGVRSRTITWTDPGRARFRLRNLDGYERLAAMKRGDASPPPAVALLGLSFDELERGRTVFSVVAAEWPQVKSALAGRIRRSGLHA